MDGEIRMKILLTGTEGYVGTMMAPTLMQRGHKVTGVDTGFYRSGWLYHGVSGAPEWLNRDIREITDEELRGFDAVVHLAELSNDPLGQLNPTVTFEINHQGSVALARKCKAAGVPRFVYASSCSVYGVGEGDEIKTEESPVRPQTAYAECKAMVERDVSALADDNFSPTFLRNATAFGPSPRMRFDIVLNNLSGLAWTTREIKLTSDGTPWRPLVHVLDMAEAVACTLEAPRQSVHDRIFNVGDSDGNYRVREIAEIVAETFPGCALTIGNSDGDNRSYRVSFEKIREHLPTFRCRYDARAGAEQLRAVFERIGMTAELFQSPPYTRLKMLKHLIETEQLDTDLFWRDRTNTRNKQEGQAQP
ncbi:MAG: SDR family oxidoreductase [Capsulimonadales bacterium]|nr:SDR family oxidoreductase [Capsulimonadales bacterium]